MKGQDPTRAGCKNSTSRGETQPMSQSVAEPESSTMNLGRVSGRPSV